MERIMRSPESGSPEPWYRQFWPWFLIFIPGLAVVGGIVTIYVATSRPHTMVVDDYARIGLATHRKMERDERAAELGLTATVSVGRTPAEIRVRLDGDLPRPDHLLLSLSHPTLASADRSLTLPGYGEAYSARLDAPLEGRWYVQIEAPDGDWRLAGELRAGMDSLRLVPPSP
jgi:hypothetical protein